MIKICLIMLLFLGNVWSNEDLKESVFTKISPEKWVLESEHAYVIEDKYPKAPVHLLVISKEVLSSSLEASPELLGEMLDLAKKAALKYKIDQSGFRIVINTNPEGGQGVMHLHIHVLGGRKMNWPPG